MAPEPLFTIAGIGVTAYALIYVLSLAVAGTLDLRLARQHGLPARAAVEALVVGTTAALLAGRVVAALTRFYDWPLPNPALLSIPAAIAALALVSRGRTVPPGSVLDVLNVAAAPGALFHGLQKFGCLMAGCCHGQPAWGLPWAITFTDPHAATLYPGIPLHPTQLYEAAGYLALAGLLLRLRRHPTWRDALVWIYLTGADLVRFVVEFYRADPRPALGPLTVNQWVCVGWMVVGVGIMVRSPRSDVRSHQAGDQTRQMHTV